jgi:hypothetical protein
MTQLTHIDIVNYFINKFEQIDENHFCLVGANPKKSKRKNVWGHCSEKEKIMLEKLFISYKLCLPRVNDGLHCPLPMHLGMMPKDYPKYENTIKQRILQSLNYIKMKLNIPQNTEKTTQPTNYFIILDNSGSMSYSIPEVRQTVLDIKNLTKPTDTVSLAYFSSYNDFAWIFKGASLHNSDIAKLVQSKIYARGLTCFNQVLETLEETVKDVNLLTNNSNNVFYFASDGYPNDRSPESELYAICKKNKTKFVASNVLGYSNYYNRNVLLKMAETLGGTFTHISNGKDMAKANQEIFKSGKKLKIIPIDQKYDLVWQVLGKEIRLLTQKPDNSVDILEEDDSENTLYAVNYSELNTVELTEPSFVYSLAYVLSQQNKANLGVSVLKRSGDQKTAKTLQKAFTTSGKGNAENLIKSLISEKSLPQTEQPVMVPLSQLLEDLVTKDYYLDVKKSEFSKISRGANYVNNVEFVVSDSLPKITNVISNESRPNISLQTVQIGQITKVLDEDLRKRIDAYNVTASKAITFPIAATTFKNYALVSNGDFNFTKLVLNLDSYPITIIPDNELEIFENSDEPLNAKEFAKQARALIVAKAESSVINYLIKEKGGSVAAVDLRVVNYGEGAVELLKELGLDSQMRYAAKQGSNVKDENADFIEFLSISCAIDKASSINAKEAYAKIQAGKLNKPAEICKPFFDKYVSLESSVKPEDYVKLLQDASKTNKTLVSKISEKLSEIKFRMATTNAWFEDVPKSDKFMIDDVIIKVENEKEYL